MISVTRRCAAAIMVTTALLAAPAAVAETYPSRPVTLVYPYAAGSNTDNAFRAIGEKLGKELGQPVIHTNQTGAGGRVGLEAAIRAQPDGYTIGVMNLSTGVVQPLTDPTMALEAGKDFTPLQDSIQIDLVVVARAELPFDDITGMIAYAKEHPGELNYATAGVGTGGHLGMVALSHQTGIEIEHIPFQGTALAVQSLTSGETDISLLDASAKPQVDAGILKVLGTAGPGPNPVFPDAEVINTIIPGYENVAWLGIVAPPGLSAEAEKTLVDALARAIRDPKLQAFLASTGWTVIGGTPEDFVQRIRHDLDFYRPLVEAVKE